MIEQDAAIGFVGTAVNIGNVHAISKLPLIIDMLPIGRLELVPFLVMLSPKFWQFSSSWLVNDAIEGCKNHYYFNGRQIQLLNNLIK